MTSPSFSSSSAAASALPPTRHVSATSRSGSAPNSSATFGSLLDPAVQVRSETPGRLSEERVATCRGSDFSSKGDLGNDVRADRGAVDEPADPAFPLEEDRTPLHSESTAWLAASAGGATPPAVSNPIFSPTETRGGEAGEVAADPAVASEAANPSGAPVALSTVPLDRVDHRTVDTPFRGTSQGDVLPNALATDPHEHHGRVIDGEPGQGHRALHRSNAVTATTERAFPNETLAIPAEGRRDDHGIESDRVNASGRDRATVANSVRTDSAEDAATRGALTSLTAGAASAKGLPISSAGESSLSSTSAWRVATPAKRGDEPVHVHPLGAAAPRQASDSSERLSSAAEFSGRFPAHPTIDSSETRSTRVLEKNASLLPDQKREAKVDSGVGIEAANTSAVMRSDSSTTPTLGVMPGTAVPMLVAAGHVGDVRVVEGGAPWTAVGRVFDAADVLWATDRAGVDLKLEVGGEGIWVRVDYREGEVTATFRADSPELRDRLTAAWQQHASTLSDQRPYRLSEPLFTANGDLTSGTSSHGSPPDGDASRRGSHDRDALQWTFGERIPGAQPLAAARGASPADSTRLNDGGSRHRLSVFA